MNGMCCHPAGCFRSGTWVDEDDGKHYCGEHVAYVAADAPHDALEAEMRERLADREEERRERREEDEVARRSW